MIVPQRLSSPVTVACALCLFLTIAIFSTSHGFQAFAVLKPPFKATGPQLRLLLPATATNLDLCKLLLSAVITGFPNPTLLGWGGNGLYNGTESHLFKISETLAYLNTLPPSADDDLVLVLDAYDVWLQLRPEVLIHRYFTAIDKANTRLKRDGLYDADHGGARIKSSILFGPDKTCWPDDRRRAACWAVPESTLPSDIFGPATDSWMVPNRPRWLNSGTIMGPAKDMREMFNATMEVVRQKFDNDYKFRNSDQFYFQEMWAEQEVERLMLRDGMVYAPLLEGGVYGVVPNISQDARTEFHVVLDYDSDVFQTAAAYTEYLTWMSFNHSTAIVDQTDGLRRIDQMTLPRDVLSSRPPFDAGKADETLPSTRGWADLMLGTNTATQQVFPVWHMTGEKSYRKRWWPRMWFHPHAEALFEASRKEAEADIGVWTDQGTFLPWDGMCKDYSQDLFLDGA